MSYPALSNREPEEIEFLSDILEDLEAVIGDTGAREAQVTQLKAVKSILSEALKRHRLSGDGNGLDESQDLFQQECAVGDSSHSANGSSGDEWEFKRLCKWIVNQVQATGLECQCIIDKLEARCGTADATTAKGTPIQARPYNNPLGGSAESHSNSCYISLLPVEVLQQIFRLAASPHIWVQAPLVLSHVNSHFRAIVLDTPSLWIALDESLPLPVLRLYGTRSKNDPLDVFTRVDDIYDGSTRDDDWFEFLKLESSRIGKMTVAGYNPTFITKWVERLQRVIFTSLAKMAVRNLKEAEAEVLCPIWASFPCLRDLWIEGCWCLGWVGPEDPFPPTLRSLKLTNISDVYYDDLTEALGGVLGLVSLVIEDFALDTDVSVPANANRVTLDFLEELELTSVAVADMHAISLLVATPSLSSLSITLPDSSDGGLDFLTTFTAKHPRLSSLGIFRLKLESQELEMMLHKLPNLTHLHIRSSDLDQDHVAFLESEPAPFPQLSIIIS